MAPWNTAMLPRRPSIFGGQAERGGLLDDLGHECPKSLQRGIDFGRLDDYLFSRKKERYTLAPCESCALGGAARAEECNIDEAVTRV